MEVTSLISKYSELRGRRDSRADEEVETFEAVAKKIKSEQHDRLKGDLELVDKCLWLQTTSKADAIFQTVTNLSSLHEMVKLESERVKKIRKHVHAVKDATTHGRSQVLVLERKRNNAIVVLRTCEAMKRVRFLFCFFW